MLFIEISRRSASLDVYKTTDITTLSLLPDLESCNYPWVEQMWHLIEVGYRPLLCRHQLVSKQPVCVYLVINTAVTFISSTHGTTYSTQVDPFPLPVRPRTAQSVPYKIALSIWQTRSVHGTDFISNLNEVCFENITSHLIFLNKSQVIALLPY
jgi:hypothetical protein